MSAAIEAYLTRLYLDAEARRAFAADPRSAARRAGLSAIDATAMASVDPMDLEMAAASYAAKRAAVRRPSRLSRLLARWRPAGASRRAR